MKLSVKELPTARRVIKALLARHGAPEQFLNAAAVAWGISLVPVTLNQKREERRAIELEGRQPRNFAARRKEKSDAKTPRAE
jgi:hypothetical protein